MKRIKRSPLVTWLALFSLIVSLCGSAVFATNSHAQTNQPAPRDEKAKLPALSRYATDLTELARKGRLEQNADYASQVTHAIQILSRDENNNPVLTGESVAETKAVAESLAARIAAGDVPQSLRGKRLFSLNLDKLFAGLKSPEEFTARLQTVLAEAAQAKSEVILFAPELQQFVGQRASQAASAMMANALKRGDVQLIGSASNAAYAQYIQSDDEIKDLFPQVRMNDATVEASKSEAGKNADDYVGDKVSPDLRQALENSNGTDRVTVILQVADINSGKLNSLFRRYDVKVVSRLPQLGALTVELPVKAAEELAANAETRYLSLNNETHTLGYSHVENTTGAINIRTGVLPGSTKLDGTGVGIAIIDSGVWKDHKAFEGIVAKTMDFTGENKPDSDPFGHGTHVAGLAVASSSVLYGAFTGIAPKAKIISLRVLNAQGTGTSASLLSALDWVMTNKTAYNIKVINMSLGAYAVSSYQNDPVCRAVRRLVDAGVVVVAAAGNNGKNSDGTKIYGHIHSPGIEPAAITVGASNSMGTDVRSDDTMATYSSRGPTRSYYTDTLGVKHYDNLIKPDLVAPGNKLYSAESDKNLLVVSNPALDIGYDIDKKQDQMTLSGSSMSSPIVAGAAALLLQANPKLTPNMVKMILMYTAQPINGFNQFEQGAGQLNIDGAVRLARLVRTDLTDTTPVGSPLLTTATPPVPQSTIAGQTFTWGQGVILNYTFATGRDWITKYQGTYRTGVLLTDAVCVTGGAMSRNGILMSDGILLSDTILTSDGILLSDGVPFMNRGQLMGDGILLSDTIIIGDGILLSDSILLSDGILLSDSTMQAYSSMMGGDDTPSMQPVITPEPEN